ncbi:MAG: cyclase family protein [Bdellovibrionota bacterium]
MNVTGPYLDISPVLRKGIAVFPGDTAFSRTINMSFKDGQHLDLSDIRTTLHVGAHTDAPSHYHGKGKTIDERDLSLYMGPCQVIKVKATQRLRPSDLSVEIKAPRVLFRTDSFNNPDEWHNDFSALSAELILFLKAKGVVLVGIDTPSVDPATDKTLESHKAIFESDMAILEGVILSHVDAGLYQLIALPLRIEGADASPVRAILLPEKK